ncbi:MAG: molybdopterin molybdotransferase MoeA [Actinobacteria bacterium]|nr:molybdopterin molybdotransferase MoeA [Actinomycetota bacterium]
MTDAVERHDPATGLVPFETYLADVLDRVEPLAVERIGIAFGDDLTGRHIAEPITAVWNTPGFTNSAMDGFAVASRDLAGVGEARAEVEADGPIVGADPTSGASQVTLPVSGDIAAGSSGTWTPGTAVRIMTGAPMPEGTDTVVPVEHTDHPSAHEPLPETVRLPADWPGDRHVRHRGSDVQAGSEVLPAGTPLDGAALTALMAAGVFSAPVRSRARVGIIVTGDELVSLDDVSIAGGVVGDGKILDSNATLVRATLESFGAEVVFEETSSDDPDAFDAALGRAWQVGIDCLITTGGASVGAHDVTRRVLAAHGVVFVAVAMQPAKPQGFGVVDGVVVCALPGNPGAVHASLHVIVRPIIAKLTGARSTGPVPMVVAEGWSAKPGMRQFVPVTIEDGRIRPVIEGGVASHRFRSLARADGLAIVTEDVTEVRVGEQLPVVVTRSW